MRGERGRPGGVAAVGPLGCRAAWTLRGLRVPGALLLLAACTSSAPTKSDRAAGSDTAARHDTSDTAGIHDSATTGDSADTAAPPRSSRLPILDFGRDLAWIADPAARARAYDRFAPLVDVAEASRGSSQLTELLARNQALVTFGYQLDLTACFHQECGGSMPLDTSLDALPERYFLHVSEPTRLRFRSLDGRDLGTVDIPACPEGAEPTLACRARTFVWGDTRYLLAVGDDELRAWMAARLLATTDDTVRGVFLDEHSHLFADAMKFGAQAIVEAGGGLREYGGRRPDDASLATDWNADVVGALATYRAAFDAEDRFLLVNVATYFAREASQAQALAAGGVTTEGLWRPDAFDGTDRFLEVVEAVRRLAAEGGRADLYGTLRYTGPSGYTAGGYADAAPRYRMWRLAASHLARASEDDPGVVYLNPTLALGVDGDPLAEWLPAYTVDLGFPVDAPSVALRTTYTASNGASCSAVVLQRTFTGGTVLVRAKDAWNCNDWDEVSAVEVLLATPMSPLAPDGSWGETTRSVRIRNGEAWILGATPPP